MQWLVEIPSHYGVLFEFEAREHWKFYRLNATLHYDDSDMWRPACLIKQQYLLNQLLCGLQIFHSTSLIHKKNILSNSLTRRFYLSMKSNWKNLLHLKNMCRLYYLNSVTAFIGQLFVISNDSIVGSGHKIVSTSQTHRLKQIYKHTWDLWNKGSLFHVLNPNSHMSLLIQINHRIVEMQVNLQKSFKDASGFL